jgi:hypothetical protein
LMQISRLLMQLPLNSIRYPGTDGNGTADESRGKPDGKVFRPSWLVYVALLEAQILSNTRPFDVDEETVLTASHGPPNSLWPTSAVSRTGRPPRFNSPLKCDTGYSSTFPLVSNDVFPQAARRYQEGFERYRMKRLTPIP